MPDIVIHGIVSAMYVGLAWHFWNTRWRTPASVEGPAITLQAWERGAILVPLALHGWLLYRGFFAAPELRLGFAQALSATFWLGVALYWIESLFTRLDGVEPLVLPVAAAAVVLPMLFPGRVSPQPFGNVEFTLHVLVFILAYGVLTIAILQAALMAFLERELHRPREAGAAPLRRFASLPPLLSMERLLFRLIAVAFGFLSVALVLGIALSESTFGRALRFDHKTVFSVLAWLTLGILLVGRHAYGWRGRTALRWSLAGFIFLMLAYVGRSFVLEVLLGRS